MHRFEIFFFSLLKIDYCSNYFSLLIFFCLVVVSATNLAPRRKDGTSSCFAEVCLHTAKSKTKMRTKVVAKNLSPVWNEKFYIGKFDPSDSVSIACYDKTTFGKEFEGKVTVPLSEFTKVGYEERTLILKVSFGFI